MTTAALTFHARPRTGGIVRPKNGRTAVTAVDVLAGLANVIRPLALTGGILAVGVFCPADASAEPPMVFTETGVTAAMTPE
ncbi:hypothetical protein [Mycolicibacterium sediminis]|uniref:Uncharacterized protein n=1 Tax=Mycolicibacterium sediminis TaxID=1286180 RepID=A0A7I7QVB1_9MYCO|nr:hypothetical protein [Mycolicibacterium sediminis]BBY30288.1 hypothetical protein MSEDJ_43840 [Mycolicibacterium sediminis]